MPASPDVAVYIEKGSRRTFACAVDWPGWCRSGPNEPSALEALLDAGPRYARALEGARLGFVAPTAASAFRVTDRVTGDATTDFGAPSRTPEVDRRALDGAELRRARAILRASWRAYDAAAAAAKGRTLAKGPRGGGRDLVAMLRHLVEADAGYVGALGWRYRLEAGTAERQRERTRRAVLDGLAASARGEIPARGPRGGVRWKPRHIVRRSAWHWLDHAWEIEDRLSGGGSSARSPGSNARSR